MFIGICSYYPDSFELRNHRISAHNKQLEWLKKHFDGDKIVIVAQNYHEEDYHQDSNIEYVKVSIPLGLSGARNKLLELFYQSDEDYLLLLDDDIILYPYYGIENFLQEIRNHPEKFLKEIDMALGTYPMYTPFKKSVYEDKMNLTKYKFVPKSVVNGMAITFLKNFKKYYNKEVYFDSEITKPPEFKYTMEDTDFWLSCLKEGFRCYRMPCMIVKVLNMNISTIYDDEAGRLQKNKDSIDYIIKKWYSDGIRQKKDFGRMDTKIFNSKYNRTKQILYIDRDQEIQFSDNEIPKGEKNTAKRRLFDV